MRFSSKTRYSLRILLQIALEAKDGQVVKGKEIAKQQKISDAYLEQIMIHLKASGLIRTVRGCRGGYALGRSPEEITVLHIIELFEGKIEFADCKTPDKRCEMLDHCFTSAVWQELSQALAEAANKITLASIIEKYASHNIKGYVI